jgi:hypothetical protein
MYSTFNSKQAILNENILVVNLYIPKTKRIAAGLPSFLN